MAPHKFHVFPALPLEIQDSIWELCLPRRVISTCYTKDLEYEFDTLPGMIKLLPVRALIPFRPPLISRVCRRSRATAMRYGQFTPVLADEDMVWGPTHELAWFNKKADIVCFTFGTLDNDLDLGDAFGDDAAAPEVFELARDVGRPLLISSLASAYEPRRTILGKKETTAHRLYDQFLKGREYVYYAMVEVTLVVSGKDREGLVKTGLFGLLGEDTAIIPSADKATLQQYASLFDVYDVRETLPYDSGRDDLDREIKGKDHGDSEPRTLIHRLLEDICKDEEEPEQYPDEEDRDWVDVLVEGMMNEDSSLKPDHPLVEKLGISMPTFERVVVFELRVLDTLLGDAEKCWETLEDEDLDDLGLVRPGI